MIQALALVRRHPHFRRLFVAESISLFGDWFTYVAVSVLALERGQGLLAVAMVLVAHTLPNALASPLSGFIADRFDRRTVIVVACVSRGILTLGMAAAAGSSALWLVQLLLMLRTAGDAFYEPGAQAVLARVVPAEDLVPANALFATAWSTIFTLGVAAGGLLSGLVGPSTCILLDALTFFVSAAMLIRLPRVLPDRDGERSPFRLSAIGTELMSAWRFAGARPALARAVLGKTPVGIAGGGAWLMLTQQAHDNPWHGSISTTLGLLHALRAVGTGVGPIVWMRAVQVRWPRAPIEVATLTMLGGVLALAYSAGAPAVAAASVVWGIGASVNWVLTTSSIQRDAADGVRGRLFATDQFGQFFGMCVGALLAAVVGQSSSAALGATATVIVAAAIVGLTRLRFPGSLPTPQARL